jgi:hypothetical protein
MEPIDLDPTCPDFTFTLPEGGVSLPDGGTAMIPPGLFGDAGNTLKGCCDQTAVCGFAFVRSFTFNGQTINISSCTTQADIGMFGGGVDAGPTKSCTYVAP